MYDEDFIAGCAELAMLLEVSGTPKPGNVDRTHSFEDLRYEHFLASAVGISPVFRQAASQQDRIGDLILSAVKASAQWQRAGNCHFGAILLLIPLCMAAGQSDSLNELKSRAAHVVENTSSSDAVQFYKSFQCFRVRVDEHDTLDVYDPASLQMISDKKLTLYAIMQLSKRNDTIAAEWTEGFPRTFHGAQLIKQYTESGLNLNDAIIRLFLTLLSKFPDTHVRKKWGEDIAHEISKEALLVLEHGNPADFDEDLIRRHINPGTTADLVIGSLFIALLGGFRY
ncbi:MAG: triphosphoribosyl-dephospho-CoA synthase [Euryarchaeota archaeon]|nr:triphosphoribosyl-dephospho-CoA synthase [Euryarchaeota archaeon]